MQSDAEIRQMIAERVRSVREINHLTQKQAGALVGVEQETWSNWENGVRGVDSVMLVKISRAFLEPMEFFTDPAYRSSLTGKLKSPKGKSPGARAKKQPAPVG